MLSSLKNAYRYGALALVLVIVAPDSSAQGTRFVSTLDKSSASTWILESLNRAAQLRFESVGKCPDSIFKDQGSWVLLTTAQCLTAVDTLNLRLAGPGLGATVFLFTLRGRGMFGVNDRELRKVGFVEWEEDRAEPFVRVLEKYEYLIEPHHKSNYASLLVDLKNNKLAAVAVLEDGSGAALDAFFQSIQRFPGGLPVEEIDLGQSRLASFVSGPEYFGSLVTFDHFVNFVALRQDNRVSNKHRHLFRVANKPGPPAVLKRKPDFTFRRWLRKSLAEEPADRPAFAVELPVVVSRTASPAFTSVVSAASYASLIMPLAAVVDPCYVATERNYQSFVTAGAGNSADDSRRLAPLWEHASVLAGRGEAGDKRHRMEVDRLKSLGGVEKRATLVSTLRSFVPAGVRCQLQRPMFGNVRLAKYQQGISNLIKSLETSNTSQLQHAAACLVDAIDAGSTPTCHEPVTGMWTEVYAPWLPAAIAAQKD